MVDSDSISFGEAGDAFLEEAAAATDNSREGSAAPEASGRAVEKDIASRKSPSHEHESEDEGEA